MTDQQQLWDELHSKGIVDVSKQSSFAQEVSSVISSHSKILELGCGVGYDAVFFANAGHSVIATDFSDVAIKKNSDRFKDIPNVAFRVLDMSLRIDFPDKEFNVVYARLSLHYFSDSVTRKIFHQVWRILKPNGFFCFVCKSIQDPMYGKGIEVEKDMFDDQGHVRHYFSEDYAKEILGSRFIIVRIESGRDDFYGKKSGFIKVIAKAKK